jgi:hypothetical protein
MSKRPAPFDHPLFKGWKIRGEVEDQCATKTFRDMVGERFTVTINLAGTIDFANGGASDYDEGVFLNCKDPATSVVAIHAFIEAVGARE